MTWKFWQRSIENPSTPITTSNLDGQLISLGGGSTKSGKAVTPDTAWNYSAIYAAIRLLSETVAQLPLALHQKQGNTRRVAVEHPLYKLISAGPSERMTSFVWRETQMGHVLSWGNGYAFIERSGSRVKSLTLLAPNKTTIDVTRSGILYTTEIDGRSYVIDAKDILHVPAMGTDGICGRSPISLHRETIGLSMRATEFGAEFFGNGTSMGGILKHPATLGTEGRIRLKTAWDKLKGSGYQGVAVLEEGMDYTRIGIPPNDAQFLETRKFQITEIARIYNIPPHMLRDLEKSAFNNMTEQSIEFLRYTMTPWLIKWEQELNRKLLTASEIADGYYFKFIANGLLRGTQEARYAAYGQAITDGWLSRNEVRELEDLDPVEGLDDYLVPLNMGKSDEDAEEMPEEEPVDRFLPLLQRAADQICAFDAKARKSEDWTRYIADLPKMLERNLTPVLLCINKQGKEAEIGKVIGDYRAELGENDMVSSDLLARIVKLIGGKNES